jgi:iron(III) transport system permease protein
MSHTLALHPVKKRDAIFLWVLLGWLAFALLPSWSLDYGLLESTAMKSRGLRLVTVQYQLAVVSAAEPAAGSSVPGSQREQRSRHYLDAGWAFSVWRLSSSAPP